MEKYFSSLKRKSLSEPHHNIDDLPYDPGERIDILDYHPNIRDEVRRGYLAKGLCQPDDDKFEQIWKGSGDRRFNPAWFKSYPWLEYSKSKQKAFCFCCYLFKDDVGKRGGNDAFVKEGFNGWNKPERFNTHVGKQPKSIHVIAAQKCDDLLNQRRSIKQGLAFRGHDETEESVNKGNFKELVKYTGEQNDAIKEVILKNAPKNNQMISSVIQKDIVHCFAEEVVKSIIEEIDHGVFGLLVDESADVSHKEQMAVLLRFVDKNGIVKERFIGVVHVKKTSSLSLKSSVDNLFAKYIMSLQRVRGQGYDGTSNMKGEFNGLRSLVAKESKSAYYVHCFAHQLQLVVVAIAKKHFDVDKAREIQRIELEEGIRSGDIKTGTGQNQERSFARPGNTRWGSHYKTLLRMEELFSPMTKVLEYIQDEGVEDSKKRQAYGLLDYLHTFDFVFYLHMMLLILGLTENLSMALQRKDQDILNAMSLVESTKRELQRLRDDGWDSLMTKIFTFCEKHDVEILTMEDAFVYMNRRKKTNITNKHHYKVNCFIVVLDLLLQEFNDRFTEVNTDLLICVASLSPIDSFHEFDKEKLVKRAKFYPDDFSYGEILSLEQHLEIYINNVRRDERFNNLQDLGDLSSMMVKTQKHIAHPLVYRLLKLALTLHVATASVERCFSEMKLVKTTTRNRIGDQFLSDCLVCNIEKELLGLVTNENVIRRFQMTGERRIML